MTSLTIAEPEAIQMRTIIYEFYGSMNPNNIIDLDVTDNGLFTLPPFLYINENNSLTFRPETYETLTNGTRIHLTSSDLTHLMGYITTIIRFYQLRYERV